MVKILKFASSTKHIPDLKPSKDYIPDWYKKMQLHINGKPEIRSYNKSKTVKACIPFLDSLTSGYMLETYCDIQVEKIILEDGSIVQAVNWLSVPDPISIRDNYAWSNPTAISLPKGYSIIFTHPFNRYDLPFITMSGIIDMDIGMQDKANLPFFFKKDFEGIIPTGTPIAQIVPFKREKWKSEKDDSILEPLDRLRFMYLRTMDSYYKKFVWKKKEYS
jgi:hypothetical protein